MNRHAALLLVLVAAALAFAYLLWPQQTLDRWRDDPQLAIAGQLGSQSVGPSKRLTPPTRSVTPAPGLFDQFKATRDLASFLVSIRPEADAGNALAQRLYGQALEQCSALSMGIDDLDWKIKTAPGESQHVEWVPIAAHRAR